MDWQDAPDIKARVEKLTREASFSHLEISRIFCFRSRGSKSRARARIWSLPRIWQKALKIPPAYCVEVLAEKFDKLELSMQKKILLHELLHIPRNFSGSLLPHYRRNGGFQKKVELLFKKLVEK